MKNQKQKADVVNPTSSSENNPTPPQDLGNPQESIQEGINAITIIQSQIKPLGRMARWALIMLKDCGRMDQRISELESRIKELEGMLGTGPISPSQKPEESPLVKQARKSK